MRKRCGLLVVLLSIIVVTPRATSQELSPWRAHAAARPLPPVVTPGGNGAVGAPGSGGTVGEIPSDAARLFDGRDLSEWTSPDGEETKWIVEDGCLIPTPNSGPIQTKQSFGDVQLHLEWASPVPVSGAGQGRGNSGVYLMTKYEVQILDSYQNETYADGQAAAVYGQQPPLVNATRPPGEWQTYDIVFRRPRFDGEGALMSPAIVTVFHNGVLVQDHFEFWGPTNWLKFDEYRQHADELPIALQDHGNPVRFRNIWLRELTRPTTYMGLRQVEPEVTLSAEELERLTGTYGVDPNWRLDVRLHELELQIKVLGRYFSLVPMSATEFEFKQTDAQVEFEVSDDGTGKQIVVNLMGSRSVATRLEKP